MRNENYERGLYEGAEYARSHAQSVGAILAQLERARGGWLNETAAYERGYIQALTDAVKTIHEYERQTLC